jgi:FKBP-type peptidyl-prolyl cis-trans isomerase SlyD
MKAMLGNVVTINYVLKDEKGHVLSSSQQDGEPLVYLHGYENIIEGLEEYLEDEKVGFEGKVTIPPEKAYGSHQEDGVVVANKDNFEVGMNLQIGEEVQADGAEGPIRFRIVEVNGDEIVLDANHPLAGQTLNFEVEIIDIRPGKDDEIEHGHPHGKGGCGHDHDHD